MKYKLIVSDFDDTIVDDSQIMSVAFRKAVKDYRAKGGIFTFATGRMISAIIDYARDLGLKGDLIGYQGAVIADIESGEFLRTTPIKKETALAIARFLEEQGIYYQIYDDDTFVVEKVTDYSLLYSRFTKKDMIVNSAPLTEYIIKNELSPVKMLLVCEPSQVKEYMSILNNEFGEEVLINTSKPFIIEIINKDVNKGQAVKNLAESLGIKQEEVICIGDSQNDIPMIEYAGLGAVVANGSIEARAAADLIIPANVDDGVAYLINNYALKD